MPSSCARGEGAEAVVQIQPSKLHHVGFRNIAAMWQLCYFCVHGESVAAEKEGAVMNTPPSDASAISLRQRRN